MLNEDIKAIGRLDIKVFDADGNIKQQVEVDNLVVTTGLGYIASRIKDAAATPMSHMAIGTGTTAAVAGNTGLGTEAARVALSATSVAANVVTFTATFPAGTGTGAIAEAGIFNANSAGTMLCRTVFSVVDKDANDSMAITWNVTIGAA